MIEMTVFAIQEAAKRHASSQTHTNLRILVCRVGV
jgi:hypothetical protein